MQHSICSTNPSSGDIPPIIEPPVPEYLRYYTVDPKTSLKNYLNYDQTRSLLFISANLCNNGAFFSNRYSAKYSDFYHFTSFSDHLRSARNFVLLDLLCLPDDVVTFDTSLSLLSDFVLTLDFIAPHPFSQISDFTLSLDGKSSQSIDFPDSTIQLVFSLSFCFNCPPYLKDRCEVKLGSSISYLETLTQFIVWACTLKKTNFQFYQALFPIIQDLKARLTNALE